MISMYTQLLTASAVRLYLVTISSGNLDNNIRIYSYRGKGVPI
jgi:hypothetical protein